MSQSMVQLVIGFWHCLEANLFGYWWVWSMGRCWEKRVPQSNEPLLLGWRLALGIRLESLQRSGRFGKESKQHVEEQRLNIFEYCNPGKSLHLCHMCCHRHLHVEYYGENLRRRLHFCPWISTCLANWAGVINRRCSLVNLTAMMNFQLDSLLVWVTNFQHKFPESIKL